MDNIARGGEEGEIIAVQNSEGQRPRTKAEEVNLYRKLIQILVFVIGLIFIVDLILMNQLLK